ncbi:hypothetical protein ES703_116276 [subsurface metagenome]
MKLVRKLTINFDRTINAMTFLAGILLIFMMLSVSVAVASRYFLGCPIGWVLESSQYILLYITFLVAAWVLRGEGHVKMDIILNRLNPRAQSLINTITSAISVIVCFILTWFGVKVTWHFYQVGYFTTTLLELPKFIFIAVIAAGSFLLFIQFVRRTYGYLRSWRISPDKETKVVD